MPGQSTRRQNAIDWVPFSLSLPPSPGCPYSERFDLTSPYRVLDPCRGPGTTRVECPQQGLPHAGLESHAGVYFTPRTKTNGAGCSGESGSPCRAAGPGYAQGRQDAMQTFQYIPAPTTAGA